MTDERILYTGRGREFAEHQSVKHHTDENVRDDAYATNIEGYFSILNRRMKGIYQHCGERHLHSYLAEFDFGHSNHVRFGIDDARRITIALYGNEGKSPAYRRVNRQEVAHIKTAEESAS